MKRKALFARKVRWLTKTLLLSALLNLALVAIFFYLTLRENSIAFSFDYVPHESPVKEIKLSNRALIAEFSGLEFEKLVDKLEVTKLVESGYLERDLALGVLVERDHFDINRATSKKTISARKVVFDDKSYITLFPGLQDVDFQNIHSFLKREKWPFTSHGLFCQLQKKGLKDASLLQAFSLTPEFLSVETLMQEITPKIPKTALTQLLIEGKWETLASFSKGQREHLDLSESKRRSFLETYLRERSKTAAVLLLLKEPTYVIRHMDDPGICLMLELLPTNAKKTIQFATILLKSPRSDLVHEKARKLVPEVEKLASTKTVPTPTVSAPKAPAKNVNPTQNVNTAKPTVKNVNPSSNAAVSPSVKNATPSVSAKPAAKVKPQGTIPAALRTHVIVQGESVSTVARKYNVSMAELMQVNQLTSETLKVGKVLKIPTKLED